MSDYSITFDSPWFLVLLGILPVLWIWSHKSLAGLGSTRRFVTLAWRSLVLLLLIFGLADLRLLRISDRLTVAFLLDQSASIPKDQREAMIDYTNLAVEQHRDASRHDRAAVIVFGRRPDIEIGPVDGDLPLTKVESDVDGEFTDLEAAMTMAMALFPEDAAKRVVIVTDGNENLGDALAQARNMATAGVGIDVVPIRIGARADVSVEKVTIPADVRQGQPFDIRVVLNNNSPPSGGAVTGKLIIKRKTSDSDTTLSESRVTLPPGKTVISTDKNSPETIRKADFYTYEAAFVPDVAADDAQARNNRATAFTHVRGRGQVLLIEDWNAPGQFDHLIETLKKERLEVTVQTSDQMFTNLAELQRFDTVILANVPRSGGDDQGGVNVNSFSDQQISALVRNTDQMGSGLIMLGGANSFGAGGWTNTEIEKAMPVDFQIDNAKIAPVGALCLIMHAGEMADGNYWQQVVAKESIKALGAHDYCGLLHWGPGGDKWLWGNGFVRIRGNRNRMLARLDRMTPGDMPEFDPAMKKGAIGFSKLKDAAVKHMIIISDGDPTPATEGTFRLLGDQKPPVMVTTVAVGSHGWLGHKEMKRIAKRTGGKYYVVKNAKALPRIYQREVRRLARPLVFEREEGITPIIRGGHEIVEDIQQPPPITGFVLTTRKDSPLVEVSIVSPRPSGDRNNTILASWSYGLGRTVAFTTDTGETTQGWAKQWKDWEDYKKLFGKIVRWSMRPVDESGNYLVATDVVDGKAKVIINAWDKDDEYLDFLNITGTVLGPDMQPLPIQVKQTAPGRYIGEFDAQDAGSYMIAINPGRGGAPLRTGINVPYSAEYRDREANLSLLDDMVKLEPTGGESGAMIEDEQLAIGDEQLAIKFNSFRHDLAKATSRQDIWHLLLLLGGCFFFFDVFFRRVHVSFAWVGPLYADARDRLLHREPAPVEDATMARLRSRKEQVSDHIEQRRAAARFEPALDVDRPDEIGETGAGESPQRAPLASEIAPDKQQEEDSYTSRLLKAKKDALKDRGK